MPITKKGEREKEGKRKIIFFSI